MKTPQQLLQQTLEVGACLLPDAVPARPARAFAGAGGLPRHGL